MGEDRFWARLRTHLPGHVVAQRLTDRLALAVPDVVWTWDGVTGFTELKVTAPLARSPEFRIDWRPGQPAWLWRWAHAGARAVATVHVEGVGLYTLDPASWGLEWVELVQQRLPFTSPLLTHHWPVPGRVWPGAGLTPWLRRAWTSLTPASPLG
jgi:hypothetical protein